MAEEKTEKPKAKEPKDDAVFTSIIEEHTKAWKKLEPMIMVAGARLSRPQVY